MNSQLVTLAENASEEKQEVTGQRVAILHSLPSNSSTMPSRITARLRLLALTLLSSFYAIAQADQESPFQVNETVAKGEGGLGSIIWIVVGIVILIAVFFLVRKRGSGVTNSRPHRY